MTSTAKYWATRIAAVLIVLGIAAWDTWLWANWGYPYTISAVVKTIDRHVPIVCPLVAFTAGLLVSHLFWNQDDDN